MTYYPCLNLQSWEGLQQICRKLVKTKIWSFLHRKANRLSEYLEILVSKEIDVGSEYVEASYQFWGRLWDWHDGSGGFSRGLRLCLRARTARISVRYHPTSSSNSESSGFSRRGEQKVGNGGELLTAAKIVANCWFVGAKIGWSSIKQIKIF